MLQTRTIAYFAALILTALAVLLYAYQRSLPDRFADYLDSEQTVRELRDRRDELQVREHELRDNLEYLGSDPVEIEAAIRKSTNLVREGETVYRLQPVDSLPREGR